jgi:hypothetical protein
MARELDHLPSHHAAVFEMIRPGIPRKNTLVAAIAHPGPGCRSLYSASAQLRSTSVSNTGLKVQHNLWILNGSPVQRQPTLKHLPAIQLQLNPTTTAVASPQQ